MIPNLVTANQKLNQLAMVDMKPPIIGVWIEKDGTIAPTLRHSLGFVQGFVGKLPAIIDQLLENPPTIPGTNLPVAREDLLAAKAAAEKLGPRLNAPDLTLQELWIITQDSIFKAFKNLFSAQVKGISDLAVEGAEKEAFKKLGIIDTPSADEVAQLKNHTFSTAVVYGGYFDAMKVRSSELLDFATLPQVVGLLGTTKRARSDKHEPAAKFQTLQPNFSGDLPANELKIFEFVWNSLASQSASSSKLILADAATRADDQRKPPGTADTVRALLSKSRDDGIPLGDKFLCVSSECYRLRQMLDLVVTCIQEGAPIRSAAVIGPAASSYKATVVYQELAKVTNCLAMLAGCSRTKE